MSPKIVKDDGFKPKIIPFTGMKHSYYAVPPKHLDLERGLDVTSETSFSDTTFLLPPPIDTDTIVYQRVNLNVKIFGVLQLMLLAGFLGLLTMYIYLEVNVTVTMNPSIKGRDGEGAEVALTVKSSLVVNLTAQG